MLTKSLAGWVRVKTTVLASVALTPEMSWPLMYAAMSVGSPFTLAKPSQ